jgi:hydroxymethylpyrimidine/phosphomethylpyrimidine kinase
LSRVLTPNIPEAEILIGRKISGESDFPEIAENLARTYGVSVLLKAGHLNGDTLTDYFYNVEDATMTLMPSQRVVTMNTHGTGCTLSSAFAAALAKGLDLTAAAKSAKAYLEQAIISGADYEIGHGHGPVNHFWR